VAQVVVPPRLISLLSSWGADAATVAPVASDIVARYSEPHRRYHTLEHIEEMLAVADSLDATAEVHCAVWMHDVVYEPTRPGSEAQSAAYADDVLGTLGAPAAFRDEVTRLIETTVQHDPDESDVNGLILADADLAILGATRDRYERYVRDVRTEYAHIDDDAWRAGRTVVIDGFLHRPVLFHAWQLRESRETQARANLRAELITLAAS
jgi:predicted metal-dependent HD superfamily phosphohydrolase